MKEADLIKYENIPDELKQEKRWCLYKIILRDGKNTKMPIMPSGKPARSNDRLSWHSFDDCLNALSKNQGTGLGFFLGDGYIGIDIDKVSDEIMEYSMDFNASSMTADFLRGILTYAEISPSKTGLHFIGKGKVPGERKRYKNLEIYDRDRFFTITGNILKDKDRKKIVNINQELLPLYQKYMPMIDFGETKAGRINPSSESFDYKNRFSQNDILNIFFKRGYFNYTGEDLRQIYNGNYQNYFYFRNIFNGKFSFFRFYPATLNFLSVNIILYMNKKDTIFFTHHLHPHKHLLPYHPLLPVPLPPAFLPELLHCPLFHNHPQAHYNLHHPRFLPAFSIKIL